MFLHVEGFQVEVKPALLPWEAATVYEFRLGEKIGLNDLPLQLFLFRTKYYHPTETDFTNKPQYRD
jgi:hypothetical protein